MPLLSCRRFRRLAHETQDRALTHREQGFLESHRRRCAACRLAETQGALALSMLRMAAIDAQPAPQFEERVLRRYKVQRVQASLQFWSPALIGAFVAGITVLAALQIVSNSSSLPALQTPGGQAYREVGKSPVFPTVDRIQLRSLVR